MCMPMPQSIKRDRGIGLSLYHLETCLIVPVNNPSHFQNLTSLAIGRKWRKCRWKSSHHFENCFIKIEVSPLGFPVRDLLQLSKANAVWSQDNSILIFALTFHILTFSSLCLINYFFLKICKIMWSFLKERKSSNTFFFLISIYLRLFNITWSIKCWSFWKSCGMFPIWSDWTVFLQFNGEKETF